jgi:hypothetical protein
MLIKMQKTRFSDDYFIIENARSVTYRDKPLSYFTEDELRAAMSDFIDGDLSKPSRWYQMEGDGSDHAGYKLEFQNGCSINKIAFTNDASERETIRFDGEAFICNDEGKTRRC